MYKKIIIVFALVLSSLSLSASHVFATSNGTFGTVTTSLPDAYGGQPYSANIEFSYGGSGIPTVTAGGLPYGLKLGLPINDPTANLTYIYDVTISGTTNASGNYPIDLTYADGHDGTLFQQTINLNVNGNLLVVNGVPLVSSAPISITLLPTAANVAYNQAVNIQYNGSGTLRYTMGVAPQWVTTTPLKSIGNQAYVFNVQGNPTYVGDNSIFIDLSDGTNERLMYLHIQVSTTPFTPAPVAVTPTTPITSSTKDSIGTNILSPDGTVSMIASDGTRRPYTSAGAFLSYGFNSWATVVNSSSADISLPIGSFIPPRDGKIICSDRGSDKGTCYLISGGQKAGFTSATVFKGLGFSFSSTTIGDVSWMTSTSNISSTTNAHLPGVLINNNGTYQLVAANGVLGIPDAATLQSWGYSFSDAVTANNADKSLSQTGVLSTKQAGQLAPQ
jgi:hypothetical protein